MIPEFEDNVLPTGIHLATWQDVVTKLGWSHRRRELMDGMLVALRDLRTAGCRRVWLGGSLVTTKDNPDDYDLCWDMEGVDYQILPAPILDVYPPRALQRAVYRGEILPNVEEASSGRPFLEFFQHDAEMDRSRGVVEIDLESLP